MNLHRGEVEMRLGEHAYVLTPNFATLAALEAVFNENLIALAERFIEAKASLKDLHLAIQTIGGSDAEKISPEELVGKNYLVVQKAVAEFFAGALGLESKG